VNSQSLLISEKCRTYQMLRIQSCPSISKMQCDDSSFLS